MPKGYYDRKKRGPYGSKHSDDLHWMDPTNDDESRQVQTNSTKIIYLNQRDSEITKLTINIGKQIVQQAREARFNISAMTDQMLREALEQHYRNKKKEKNKNDSSTSSNNRSA